MWFQRFSVLLVCASAPALAHHSVPVNFDAGTTVEVAGEITNVAWRNPHILFTLRATDGSGEEWELETHSLSIMRRLNAAEPFVEIGDRVTVAGWPARRGQGMFVNNMLLPNGEEFVFKFEVEPSDLRWSDRMWGTTDRWFAESGDTSAEERGIFRVWSTTLAGGAFRFWLPEYPLTQRALVGKAAFDMAVDDPLLNCGLKGMPGIMGAPYPMEFHDRGDIIELRIEEYDSLRTIYMNPATAPSPTGSIMGYSSGSWDGDTLVVETTNLNWGHFHGRGIIVTDQLRLVERFTPTEGGGRLEYELTITDPGTFTESVSQGRSWVWLPDVRVEPYECKLRDEA
jgi:hypothetical protein